MKGLLYNFFYVDEKDIYYSLLTMKRKKRSSTRKQQLHFRFSILKAVIVACTTHFNISSFPRELFWHWNCLLLIKIMRSINTFLQLLHNMQLGISGLLRIVNVSKAILTLPTFLSCKMYIIISKVCRINIRQLLHEGYHL